MAFTGLSCLARVSSIGSPANLPPEDLEHSSPSLIAWPSIFLQHVARLDAGLGGGRIGVDVGDDEALLGVGIEEDAEVCGRVRVLACARGPSDRGGGRRLDRLVAGQVGFRLRRVGENEARRQQGEDRKGDRPSRPSSHAFGSVDAGRTGRRSLPIGSAGGFDDPVIEAFQPAQIDVGKAGGGGWLSMLASMITGWCTIRE